jgi:adenylate kinase
VKVTLTGTPGTGKTTISEKLEQKGFKVIHLTQFLKEQEIGQDKNGERQVPITKMIQEFKKQDYSGKVVFEGHLAHHIAADVCLVLRCHPKELRKRLQQRNYSQEKIEENVQAEALDVILSEAVQKQETIAEIDTSEKEVLEASEKAIELIKKGESSYGSIDWSECL